MANSKWEVFPTYIVGPNFACEKCKTCSECTIRLDEKKYVCEVGADADDDACPAKALAHGKAPGKDCHYYSKGEPKTEKGGIKSDKKSNKGGKGCTVCRVICFPCWLARCCGCERNCSNMGLGLCFSCLDCCT